jgi:hypothetical protein
MARPSSPVPQQHVSRVGEGLASIGQVEELRRPLAGASVTALNLHGNNIARIEGLTHLSRLSRLNLSSNSIASLEGLAGLSCLTSLNLASNRLRSVSGLAGLPALADLNLSYNYITSLDGLAALHGPSSYLASLNVAHNALASLQALSPLAGCLALRSLRAGGNPCTISPAAYAALRQVLPQVIQLDEGEAVSVEAGWQLAHAQLAAFGPGAATLATGAPHAGGGPSTSGAATEAAAAGGEELHGRGRGGQNCSDGGDSSGSEGRGGSATARQRRGERHKRRDGAAPRQRHRMRGSGHAASGALSDNQVSPLADSGSEGSSRDDGSGVASDQAGGRRQRARAHRRLDPPPRHRPKMRSSGTNTYGGSEAAAADVARLRLQAEAQRLREELAKVAGVARGGTPWAHASSPIKFRGCLPGRRHLGRLRTGSSCEPGADMPAASGNCQDSGLIPSLKPPSGSTLPDTMQASWRPAARQRSSCASAHARRCTQPRPRRTRA